MGKNLIPIFDFIIRLIQVCDTLEMTEAQAFMPLLHFLKEVTHAQYRTMQNGSRSRCFPAGLKPCSTCLARM